MLFFLLLFLISFCGGVGTLLYLGRNLIYILLSLEIILFSINFFLIYISVCVEDFLGQIFSLYILCVAASEASIGLSLLVLIALFRGEIIWDRLIGLKS